MLNASELKILVDAVQSSEFITEMKSKELIQKQEKLTILYRLVWVRTLLKDRLVIRMVLQSIWKNTGLQERYMQQT